MPLLNLGILAHIDAGKTSLTERLLHTAGVINEIGRVDNGTTQTDSLPLERERGITIRSAVVNFALGDLSVNLLDTPGHPDFLAEVERVLGVLDGAVLVLSAVEGVQPQTRLLMRTLRRLRIPTLLFVNKIDRLGAEPERVVRDVRAKLGVRVVPIGLVRDAGERAADVVPGDDATALLDELTATDSTLLAAYLRDGAIPLRRLRRELRRQSAQGLVHPVLFGSAMTGAGIPTLVDAVRTLLPRAPERDDGPLTGRVFKVDRGPAGEKIAYARLFGGAVHARDRLEPGKVSALRVFSQGGTVETDAVRAGQIAQVWGLDAVRVGDPLGAGASPTEQVFSPPSLESVVVPARPEDRHGLFAALVRLAEQDPLIGVRRSGEPRRERSEGREGARPDNRSGEPRRERSEGREGARPDNRSGEPRRERSEGREGARPDNRSGEPRRERSEGREGARPENCDRRSEIAVSLYGEVQKEVLQAMLAEVGFEVTFRPTTTLCIERPTGSGAGMEKDPPPFLATVGLRVDPGAPGSGITFGLEVELGSMPYAFMRAVEDTVRETLTQGLAGWPVTDCAVTMTHSGYWPRQSHAHARFDKAMSSTGADFRGLTPLVLMSALREAGTEVLEPVHRFELSCPAGAVSAVLPALTRLGGIPDAPRTSGDTAEIGGVLPATRVHALQRALPGLSSGEGTVETAFDHYAPVRDDPPRRPRWGPDPLDRKEYLLEVVRRVGRRA